LRRIASGLISPAAFKHTQQHVKVQYESVPLTCGKYLFLANGSVFFTNSTLKNGHMGAAQVSSQAGRAEGAGDFQVQLSADFQQRALLPCKAQFIDCVETAHF